MIINFFAGPCAGKTTQALALTHHLKRLGISVTYVPEVATEYINDKNLNPLKYGQSFIITQQLYRQENAERIFDVVVVDSPIILGIIYNNEPNEIAKNYFNQFILEKFKEKNNINFFVNRSKYFTQIGRIHNFEESKQIDILIKNFLKENNIEFDEIKPTTKAVIKIVKKLLNKKLIKPKEH